MSQWLSTYRALVPDYGLSRLCGCSYWKSVFGACVPDPELDRQFSIPSTHAFFLYGAEGNGKRTLAGALAADLVKKDYLFSRIPGGDLAGENEAETAENISALLEEIPGAIGADTAGVCVLIEDFQFLVEDKKTVRALETGLERLMNHQASCVIIGVAETREHYPARLEKLMLPCPIGLPDEKERREYLERAMEDDLPHEHGLSYKKMAEMTEGLNYDKLDKLIGLAAMLLKQRMKFLFGKNREQMAVARRQGLVFITEEMFRQMVEHLLSGIRQTDMTQCFQPLAGAVPVMHGQAAGTGGRIPGLKSEWTGLPETENGKTGLNDMDRELETELGQGRSMMDMMDDLDLDEL